MLFSQKIRLLRTGARLTQKEVANTIGVSVRSYASYENSGIYPKKRAVYDKIAELYNVDKDYLLVEDDKTEGLIKIETNEIARSGVVAQIASIFQSKDFSRKQKNEFLQTILNLYFESERDN